MFWQSSCFAKSMEIWILKFEISNNLNLDDLYENNDNDEPYKWQEKVNTIEYDGTIIDASLGSASTYFLFKFSKE